MTVRPVPLVDLQAQHQQVADAVQNGFARLFAQGAFILGPDVEQFEACFARFCGVRHCVGVSNGTAALELIFRALGIGPGHEVILPTNSFIATALAVARVGATPVLVDSDPVFHLLDVDQVAAKIGPRTGAIVPVHLYGQIAPMARLQGLAAAARVPVVEDAAQAHGASQDGVTAGGFGVAAGFSFYPAKNLGAYGDAGAVLTDAEEVDQKVRRLRNYGSETKYEHPALGFNERLDTLQAVVLNAKLAHLKAWNDARRRAARRYDELLAGLHGVSLPATLPGNTHVWHLYVIRVAARDKVRHQLNQRGVGAGVHYPVPIHLQGCFERLGHSRGDFPVAERAAEEVLSLPLFPEITVEQQEFVANELRRVL